MTGAPTGPVELALGDERRDPARRGVLPFAFDIETIPQRRYWPAPAEEPGEDGKSKGWVPPDDYIVDTYWARRQWEEMQMMEAYLPGDYQVFEDDQVKMCAAPLHATGQLPACHPATAHIVSCSFGKLVHPDAAADSTEVDVQTAQLDDFLEERNETPPQADYQIMAKPAMDELSDIEILMAERKVLSRTVELLEWANKGRFVFVSFGGKGFDLPMIRWRCVILGVTPPKLNWYEMLYPYRHREHIDLRLLFSDGDRRAKGTLSMWAKAIGLEVEESGEHILNWARTGDWANIRRYSGVEMETLIRMFQRIQGAI